jgi:hypothetical protein
MADNNNNLTTLNGLFKRVYADKMKELIPDGVKLLNQIPFVAKDKQNGSLYIQPVVLGLEHGITYATGGDAFTLGDSVAGVIKDAQVEGTQMVLRSTLSYTAASRSMGGGDKAFQDGTKFLVANMLRSMARKLEIELLYGGVGIAQASAQSGAVVTIATAHWAPGVWAGSEKMVLDFREASGGTSVCVAPVASVDMDARTITLGSAISGAHNDIGTQLAAPDTVTIYPRSAYGNEFAGIHKILTNTGSLFNISATDYNLWKGVEYSCGSAAFSFSKLMAGVAKAVEKGLDQDIEVHVNPRTWSNLLSDQAALREYDSSYSAKQLEQGASELKFHGQNGMIKIVPNIFVKEGFAYGLVMDELVRVGSSDITFKRPGQGDEFFKDLELAAGYELRCYTDQAVFIAAPGKCVLFKDIVNS